MPALVAGIRVFLASQRRGVDGRVKPGHDDIRARNVEIYFAASLAALVNFFSTRSRLSLER